MLGLKKAFIYISTGLLSIQMAAPCFATAVLEGTVDPGYGKRYNVQVIEGDQIKSPPIPQIYRAEAEMAPTSNQPQEISSLIARYNRQLEPGQVYQMSQAINILSTNYNLDPRLLTSLVAVESSFRPAAISSTGAIGLGQLKPATAQWLGVSDPFDPMQNLMGVAKYLRYLLDRYNGSVQHALAAYFQGQGTIDKNGIDDGAQYYISKVSRVFGR